ncbi:MAG: hypothetical protein A3J46_03880 [Candidatus Yanofskybacteria bacterium RIFCSPHIGHO2_02_FULL_41_11]|uniref:DUF1573 domain-containing protein n=2 Tax=Candidatus Yanofskyibacteriota TaxID=1752733 RepID=A0A1F8F5Y6_9BACT|nr:MAG: hypothetical protein A2817_01080 [Candidatus Yanofskybacteria bacterium RIFCSPHIGHO2_01_FULL_39_8b]OGN08562.1 MAG: hypothetical protein A3J46_03880 [Candidatus Yanofskybacteria bacterium RIFCSPHIGHO2_02_FULL_41_11]
MFKNPIVIFVGLTIIIIALAVVFRPANPTEESQQSAVLSSPVLASDADSFDFGSISMANGEVVHEFKVKNITEKNVKIGKMYTSCMCTTAWFIKGDVSKGPFGMPGHGYVPPVNEQLGPGEEAAIKIIFDPNAHGPAGIGKIERSIYIESGDSKPLEMKISVNVIP